MASSLDAGQLAALLASPAGLGKLDLPRVWQTPPHLELIDGLLADLAVGRGGRLLLWAPPRHGKSVITSHYFPAWYLLTQPHRRVILTSYEADFAASWGRKVRDTVSKWGRLLGVRVRDDSKAANRWEIVGHGGGMQTAGACGPILGKGADLFIVDDPTKNAEDALSATHRQKVWDWYLTTAKTRLEPGAAMVVTQQRWHTQDLSGKLIEEEPHHWRAVSIPALAEEGDVLGRPAGAALWPERYDAGYLEDLRRTSPTWFAAQYQQKPLDLEGGFFRGIERVEILDAVPARDQFERVARAWDLASTEAQAGADPDYLAGVLMGKTKGGRYIVLDVVRVRVGPHAVRQVIRQTAEADGSGVSIYVEREGAASGKMVANELVANTLAGFRAQAVPAKGSKAERAEPWAAQVEAGNVSVVRNGQTKALLDEHRTFPNGRHDDMVDACSLAFRAVARGGLAFAGGPVGG